MPLIPIKEHKPIQPADLTSEMHQAAGRIMRAVAHIDDALTIYLSSLTGSSDNHTIVLLGRVQIGDKLAKIQYLSKMQGGEVAKVQENFFQSQAFKDVVKIRNILAHSYLLGVTNDGDYCFLAVSDLFDPVEGNAVSKIFTYSTKAILLNADNAETLASRMANWPMVSTSRQARIENGVQPNPKAVPKKKRAERN